MSVADFHRLYYDAAERGGTWEDTYWFGIPAKKCPLDLWVYQEILFETRPEVIVETGTWRGGSALFLASICELLGRGRVITIDTEDPGGRPRHERITYLQGSSTDEALVRDVEAMVGDASAMVILDSDHSKDHVLAELRAYAPLVAPSGYLIVEDTNINGHPVLPGWGPGPMEAVEEFLRETDGFAVDGSREKFLLTFNPSGFLRRADGRGGRRRGWRRLLRRALGAQSGRSRKGRNTFQGPTASR